MVNILPNLTPPYVQLFLESGTGIGSTNTPSSLHYDPDTMLSVPLFPQLAMIFTILGLGLIGITSAFQPNCTLPPEHTLFVSGPNVRGTLSILWNCISILILCTWNIQHLNIPVRRPYLDNTVKYGWLWKAWWAALDSRIKLKWMILTILMPEYIMGKAVNSWISARVGYRMLRKLPHEGEQPLQMIHAYFANMGGYYLDFSALLENAHNDVHRGEQATGRAHQAEDERGHPDSVGESRPTPLERLVKEAQVSNDKATIINLSQLRYNCWTLNLTQLCIAGSEMHLHGKPRLFTALPYINPQDLEKANRGDALVKLIAILQVSWLVVQLLIRTIRHLPSSQLEIAVLAFSFSSSITYLILWDHPQGVDWRTGIQANRLPEYLELRMIAQRGPRFLWTWKRTRSNMDGNLNLIPIPNDASHEIGANGEDPSRIEKWAFYNNGEVLSVVFGSILGGTVFGGLHCLAWNSHFPTSIELLLWRISSVLMTALPVLSIIPNYMWSQHNTINSLKHSSLRYSRMRRLWGLVLLIVFLVPYLLARLFILFDVFRTLFALPPKAFVNTFASNLPD
jgi:hypothetical protein